MIEKLKQINNKLIEISINNPEELKKQKLIKKMLEEKNCFLKMNIEQAYSILKDLNIPNNEIKDVYFNLIDFEK